VDCLDPATIFAGATAWQAATAVGINIEWGTKFTALEDLNLTGVAVFARPSGDLSARDVHVWNAAGTKVFNANGYPTPPGITTIPIDPPLFILAGEQWIVSYCVLSSNTAAQVQTGAFASNIFVSWDTPTGANECNTHPTIDGGLANGIIPIVCIATTGYCRYGTRVKPDQSLVLVLDSAALSAAALLVPELRLLVVAWSAFLGWTFVPGTVCAGPPPAMPTFTDADFLFGTQIPAPGSIGKFWTALQSALWPVYCECVPATGSDPPAIPEPLPVVNPPPSGFPTQPSPVVCDDAALCATLDAIIRMLSNMSAQLGWLRTDVELIQRQGVPFGYVTGAVHPGLTGDGSFDVADILGLAVNCTTIPGYLSFNAGTPDEHLFLGRLNLGTLDGWAPRLVLVDQPQLFLGVSGALTVVGYSLAPGVVATITELRREP